MQQYHAEAVEAVAQELKTNTSDGLDNAEVARRQEEHGLNRLRAAKKTSAWTILLGQFKSIVILLLLAAAVVAFVTARIPEGVALLLVITVNTLIGFFSEWRALRSMEALRAREQQKTTVRRDGQEQEVGSDQLVPGDVVVLANGTMVPADLRLVHVEHLRINEAALTGESVAVAKGTEPVEEAATLGDRTCMAYKGTTIVDGSGEGIVAGTGMNTELGRIAELAEEAEEEALPLQKRLDQLGRRLAYITLVIAALVAGAGLAAGRDTVLMLETAIALGIAAIPEGLPIVATIALARGMWIMARRNALINRLPAVETLGATRVIFTDKTGTLTQNEMRVHSVATAGETYPVDTWDENELTQNVENIPRLREFLETAALCSTATLATDDKEASGEPMELAILRTARSSGIDLDSLREKHRRLRIEAFSRKTMMMATFHEGDGEKVLVAVKGAPRRVLEHCTSEQTDEGTQPVDEDRRRHWEETIDALAGDGLRVLAVARKTASGKDAAPYEDLCLLGLVGLLDPAREDVPDAIVECQEAGMQPIMVTGDEPATAQAIARKIGLKVSDEVPVVHGRDLEDLDSLSQEEHARLRKSSVFARVTPEQKLKLIALYQEAGDVVAMTGDGINDAPALKKADIGIAMGKRGTEAAKQVSDMILQDDRFGSIVAAVKQGRIIFANIRKSVMFMLCTNVAEILVVGLASLVNAPLPLRPLQILYLNVLTDVFPALALGVGKGDAHVMDQPPRQAKESVLTKHHWLAVAAWSVVIGICVLGGLALAKLWLNFITERAVTVSFLTLGFGKLLFVFNLRDRQSSRWRNDIVRNPWIWASIALCAGLLAAAVYWPFLSSYLETADPGPRGWGLIALLSLAPAFLGLFVPAIRFYGSTESDGKEAKES